MTASDLVCLVEKWRLWPHITFTTRERVSESTTRIIIGVDLSRAFCQWSRLFRWVPDAFSAKCWTTCSLLHCSSLYLFTTQYHLKVMQVKKVCLGAHSYTGQTNATRYGDLSFTCSFTQGKYSMRPFKFLYFPPHRLRHLTFNIFIQVVVGLPLEMVHGSVRVSLIYMAGVLAGKANFCHSIRISNRSFIRFFRHIRVWTKVNARGGFGRCLCSFSSTLV